MHSYIEEIDFFKELLFVMLELANHDDGEGEKCEIANAGTTWEGTIQQRALTHQSLSQRRPPTLLIVVDVGLGPYQRLLVVVLAIALASCGRATVVSDHQRFLLFASLR